MSITPDSKPPIKPRHGKHLSLKQVLILQDVTFDAAKGLGEDFNDKVNRKDRARIAQAISQLAKGWTVLQDAKRELQGKPRIGVLKSEQPKKKRANLGEAEILDDVPFKSDADPSPEPKAGGQSS